MRTNVAHAIGFVCLLLFAGTVAGCAEQATGEKPASLYFYSESDLHDGTFGNPVTVPRPIALPRTDMSLGFLLRQLFAGPTADDTAAGARTSADLLSLAPFFLGVHAGSGTAVVDFQSPAQGILLEAPAARQTMVKAPIEATLEQFPGITDVRYTIGGKTHP